MVFGRPEPFEVALVEPKRSRFGAAQHAENRWRVLAANSLVGSFSPCSLLLYYVLNQKMLQKVRDLMPSEWQTLARLCDDS